MDAPKSDQRSISIIVLSQALEAKRAELRSLQVDVEELERAIRQLQDVNETPQGPASRKDVAVLVSEQEKAVEDDQRYTAAKLREMQRIQIAVMLAQDFGDYITTSAFRKALSKPGVLRSTSQVGSVASRLLTDSDAFTKIAEGLYRLKR